MKLLSAAAACVAALVAPVALAEGTLDLLYVPQTEFGLDVSSSGGSASGEVDGDGFGVRGLVRAGDRVGLRGEWQSVTYEDNGNEADADSLRFGLGVMGPSTSGGFLEYNKIEIDDFEMDGYALRGRVAGRPSPSLQMYVELGWAWLEDEDGDSWDGPEGNVGLAVDVNPAFAVLADYRVTQLEWSESGITAEFEFTDLRVGARLMFGGRSAPARPRKAGKKRAA